MGNISISYTALPSTYCFDGDFNHLLKSFANQLAANFVETSTLISIGDSPPADLTHLWFRLNADGTPDDLYYYAGSSGYPYWIAEYPFQAATACDNDTAPGIGNGFGMIWMGEEADIIKIGDASNTESDPGNCTLYTGPFWVKDARFNGRFPLGIGDFATPNPDLNTTVAVGDTGGAAISTLALDEMPTHKHGVPLRVDGADVDSVNVAGWSKWGDSETFTGKKIVGTEAPVASAFPLTSDQFETDPGATSPTTQAHAIMPPYIGVFILKRTIRKYKTYS